MIELQRLRKLDKSYKGLGSIIASTYSITGQSIGISTTPIPETRRLHSVNSVPLEGSTSAISPTVPTPPGRSLSMPYKK